MAHFNARVVASALAHVAGILLPSQVIGLHSRQWTQPNSAAPVTGATFRNCTVDAREPFPAHAKNPTTPCSQTTDHPLQNPAGANPRCAAYIGVQVSTNGAEIVTAQEVLGTMTDGNVPDYSDCLGVYSRIIDISLNEADDTTVLAPKKWTRNISRSSLNIAELSGKKSATVNRTFQEAMKRCFTFNQNLYMSSQPEKSMLYSDWKARGGTW
ncbi:hypothetical protein EYZ11_011956 [Aspergillus tanneri]|uniref:Uncharacterized protein n=1 Tax=Aspergillus tanneri TaxID=1220188 RepID=A0A4S3J6T5_9EURO|nr:hypothetical protein EYZ11_011956 [Aspergillus tanneri]